MSGVRSHVSLLRQVEAYRRDMGRAGSASALFMAGRRPKEYRRKVDVATRSSVCPHFDLRIRTTISRVYRT